MSELKIKITSQAVANQLASIVDTHSVRQLVSDWDQPFVVGNTAVFWTYASHLHYSQFTSKATDDTLSFLTGVPNSTANDLAQDLAELG